MENKDVFSELYEIVGDTDLTNVVGGKKKTPSWVKWVNGIGGLIGEVAEPGSINWKLYK